MVRLNMTNDYRIVYEDSTGVLCVIIPTLLCKEEDLLKFSPEDVISYYPNPVREELYLKWELVNENKVSSIEVFSINSKDYII